MGDGEVDVADQGCLVKRSQMRCEKEKKNKNSHLHFSQLPVSEKMTFQSLMIINKAF